ncbi:hypothetical protein LXA43DRAFT_1097025 [Ganoderma leucocontextum]|nr:hypothetical protein LXA43DRAFT_1097025 [Ganoderma leucocontextum]
MHIDEFVRVVGRIAGVGAALAEMNQELSPVRLVNQAAQTLLEEGLNTPAAILQNQLLAWEQKTPPDEDELAVEGAVTMMNNGSSDHEEMVPPYAHVGEDDESHHPSQNVAFATANTQLHDLPSLGLGLVHNKGAIAVEKSAIQQVENLVDRLDEALSRGR